MTADRKRTLELRYGGRRIPVVVRFEERTQLSITVQPDLTVTARAPRDRDLAEVEKRLRKRAGWIARQITWFEDLPPTQPPRRWISGETHRYLGRQYRLRIRRSKTVEVKLKGRFFLVSCPDPQDTRQIRRLMERWYLDHAKSHFERRLEELLPPILKRGAPTPRLRVQKLRKRWGSCSPNQLITLNTALVTAPRECIDYVITHELCHLIETHHDKAFFRLLHRMMPDWQERKSALERITI